MTFATFFIPFLLAAPPEPAFKVTEEADRIRIVGSALEASIRKKGYVSGVEAQSLLDTKTGFRDLGFGLDIVDWLMEPGSDEAYREKLDPELRYEFNNAWHGKKGRRSIEGPQICTKARELKPTAMQAKNFVAIKQDFAYTMAIPGKKAGSKWEQTIVFPAGKRWFASCDKITSVNNADALTLRIDLPGHIKHKGGDTFSEAYLSYLGKIPSKEFIKSFTPDERFQYVRDDAKIPKRMIRAYRIRDPKTGADGPWLAGMTLDPAIVSEAWCHQRGYVCMIEEFGGRPIKAGESFSAAFIIGFFDSIEEMEQIYDQYAGANLLETDGDSWKLTRREAGKR